MSASSTEQKTVQAVNPQHLYALMDQLPELILVLSLDGTCSWCNLAFARLTGKSREVLLGKAYPNPFNPATTIDFALAQDGPTRLEVFDLNGRLVRVLLNESLTAGHHDVTWTGLDQTGRPVASGAYFYRLTAPDGAVQAGRMVLVK